MNPTPRILIIEDDDFLRDFYQELLTSEGYSVEVAADGEAGLDKIKIGGFDLILLDIMLPKRDGLQVLKAVKLLNPPPKNGPIVMLTNLGNEPIINEAFALDASGYLIKSALDPDQVLTEVKAFLSAKHG